MRIEGVYWRCQVKALDHQSMMLWQATVHQNSVDHGWWPSLELEAIKASIPEKLALIATEIKEATDCYRFNQYDVFIENGKPEGLPVELADVVIRILDLMGAMQLGWCSSGSAERIDAHVFQQPNIAHLIDIYKCHDYVSEALECHRVSDYESMEIALVSLVHYCFLLYPDLITQIEAKHTYNSQRPYRHGGKAC